jgi:endo-1,4-beta-mannosidase
MTRLKVHRQIDIEVGSYQKPQEAQMTSTMVEYLQGIWIAKEAAAPDQNRSGNLMIRHEYFTRADDTNMRCTMCSNTLWRRYY